MKRRVVYLTTGAWVRIPVKLLQDERCTGADALVYAAIYDAGKGAPVQIPREKLAAAAGVSISSVKRATAKLQNLGYLMIEEQRGAPSRYTQLLLEAPKRSSSRAKKSEELDLSKYEALINVYPNDGGKEVAG